MCCVRFLVGPRSTQPTGTQEVFEVFKVSAQYPVRLGNRTYRAWGLKRLLLLKLTLMVRLECRSHLGEYTAKHAPYRAWGRRRITDLFSETSSNRTYRAWGNVELPIYLFTLHQTAPTGPGGPKLNEKTKN